MLYPKIGIRPVIDGRWGGVRESLENQTMRMAENAAKLISENLKYPDGTPVQCVIGCTTIGGGAEAARVAEQFSTQNVTATLSVTPCWCYGTETFDMDPNTIKAVWGFNGTERPGAVYLAAVLAAHAQRGLPAFSIYLFVAVLPCSYYAYAEVCGDTQTENWLNCHVHAFNYFGGATRLLIPDNCKTATSSNTQYDVVVNRSYQELAEYYGTAIVPTRVRKPKDKSAAEASVNFAETWIIAALRDRKFFTVREAQEAAAEKLEEFNARTFKARAGCRRSAYLEEEKAYMLPLPAIPFEPAVWSVAKVPNDYCISDGRNKYSVPYNLIGEKVDIRVTKNVVEVYYRGSRMACHRRLQTVQHDPLVKLEHMPEAHQKYLTYNADDFKIWAMSVGPQTEQVVAYFLESGKVPEQGYKACVSLRKLGERYGKERLEMACMNTLAYGATPSIRNISSILKSKQSKSAENAATPKKTQDLERYGITRGAAYFAKGGNR